jgi:hypothetical protein
MDIWIVLDDYGDGIAAYAYSTPRAANAAREKIEAAQEEAHVSGDTVWIVTATLDQDPE